MWLLNSYKVVGLRTWMFISNSCDCHLKSWRHAQYFSIKHKFKTSVEFYFLLVCAKSLNFIQLFWVHGSYPAGLLCPWDFPGKNTGVGSHFLFQKIFLTQGLNPYFLGLPHWEASSWEAPYFL